MENVDDGQRQVRRVQIETLDRRTIVGRAQNAVRSRIADKNRNVERADRPIRIILLRKLIDPPLDEAGMNAQVRHQLVLEPGGDLEGALILQPWIEQRAAGATRLRALVEFLARLP